MRYHPTRQLTQPSPAASYVIDVGPEVENKHGGHAGEGDQQAVKRVETDVNCDEDKMASRSTLGSGRSGSGWVVWSSDVIAGDDAGFFLLPTQHGDVTQKPHAQTDDYQHGAAGHDLGHVGHVILNDLGGVRLSSHAPLGVPVVPRDSWRPEVGEKQAVGAFSIVQNDFKALYRCRLSAVTL